MTKSPPRAATLFFCFCVLLHALIAIVGGRPFPGGLQADGNVYLELAMNLWRDGEWGTRVSVNYPPLYPILLAPIFAVKSNALRFAVIYGAQCLLLALASLSLLPAFTEALGRRRAWLLLGGLQLLGGVTYYSWNSQTEAVFSCILVAATGLAWTAWRNPARVLPWLALGLVAGLGVTLRRTALVLPLALGILWTLDLVSSLRRRDPIPWKAGVALLVGGSVGLFPELLSDQSGGTVNAYSGNVTGGHLGAASSAFTSVEHLLLAVKTTAQQGSWMIWSTACAPLVIATMLLRGWRDAPLALRRTGSLVLLTGAGLVAMTSLHMLRYRYDFPDRRGWDLYPRYLDPMEPALVALAILSAAWLLLSKRDTESHWIVGRAPELLALGSLVLLSLGGRMALARGGRVPPPSRFIAYGWPEGLMPWVFLIGGTATLALWLVLWRAGRLGPLGVLLFAVVVSQGSISTSTWGRLTTRGADQAPEVFQLDAIREHPAAPVAVVVHRPGYRGRRYYEPAFRSDHPVFFVKPGKEAMDWAKVHPDGFVLVLRRDQKRPPVVKLYAQGTKDRWRLYTRTR